MESIKIQSGTIKLAINEDPDRIVSFNPTSVSFVEKLQSLMSEVNKKEAILSEKLKNANEIEEDNRRIKDTLSVYKEMLDFTSTSIDNVFGKGTSDVVLNGEDDLDLLFQFLEGASLYVQEVRSRAVQKYIPQAHAKRKKHK